MALVFERILTPGLAELSYLIGDDATGVAAVIDPLPDVEQYLRLARRHSVAINDVFETHIHADFMSGARELCAATDGHALVHASREGNAHYGFDMRAVNDGDQFRFGKIMLAARYTPGHTPEHVAYEAAFVGENQPWAVFTGDSLFVGSAGRPDLLGSGAEELADRLYDTLFDYYAKLDDGVIIHPAHGHGSPCGADIGDRLESTIGYERQHNPYFQRTDRRAFIAHALGSGPPEPTYYSRMKKMNAEGPRVLGCPPAIPALPVEQFKRCVDAGHDLLIDTRSMLAFAGGHVGGAINIGGTPMLTLWAGWLVEPGRRLLLVLPDDSVAGEVASYFLRAGFFSFRGYLAGGMGAWDTAGHPLAYVGRMTAREVNSAPDGLQILDVRTPSEWEGGHVPGAKHIFLPEIPDRASTVLDPAKPVVTYCATGYRASIGASLLKRRGFGDVRFMPGSWNAWTAAGLPRATTPNGGGE